MEGKETKQEKFAKALLELTKSKGLSLRKLAAASGLEYSQVQRVSKGKVNVTLTTIIALCEGLDVSPSELFSYYK